MQLAVEEIQSLPKYDEKEEVKSMIACCLLLGLYFLH